MEYEGGRGRFKTGPVMRISENLIRTDRKAVREMIDYLFTLSWKNCAKSAHRVISSRSGRDFFLCFPIMEKDRSKAFLEFGLRSDKRLI